MKGVDEAELPIVKENISKYLPRHPCEFPGIIKLAPKGASSSTCWLMRDPA